MNEVFISKLEPDPEGLDFEGLRREGIKLVQALSGEVWSDYNLHDPGVTILEQLCYGLTDLLYRSNLPVEDYLTSPDGTIDYARLALARPDDVFSCRAVTENDYRKLFLDSMPNLENVWFTKRAAADGIEGLWHVYLQLSDKVKSQSKSEIKSAYYDFAKRTYAANRNLCEDLAEVTIVERTPYAVCGEIDINGSRSPSTILGEIYFQCAHYLSPRVPVHSYVQMQKAGKSLDETFTGVLTRQGYIDEAELTSWRGHFSIQELMARIEKVDGVSDIKRLYFRDATGEEKDHIAPEDLPNMAVACLHFPASEPEIAIKLFRAGKSSLVSLRDVEIEFDGHYYKRHAANFAKHKHDWVKAGLPTGQFHELSEYYSIQNHFPNIYGINKQGVPDSAPPMRKAEAKQLKAYLTLFEQLMANYQQQLQHLRTLFSLEDQAGRSYFCHVPGNEAIAEVEQIYRFDKEDMASRAAELLHEMDDFEGRRNRLLDYLLALYGERFSQNSLSQFMGGREAFEFIKLRNKSALLNDIVDLGKNRGAAFNYNKPFEQEENHAGIAKKLTMLLGLSLEEIELQVVEHLLLRPMGHSSHPGHQVPAKFYNFRVSLLVSGEGPFANPGLRKLAEETIHLISPAHISREIFWLSLAQIERFERLYQSWLSIRSEEREATKRINDAAGELIQFLLEIRKS